MSLGVGLGGDVEAHLGEHLDVERGGHRDLGRGDAGDALHGPADLEQRHRVGVGAAAELDVVHAATALQPASARVAPSSSPRPDVWPTAGQRRRPRLLGAVPSAASHAANSGITSPCIAQSSSVADSSVVRCRQRADRRVDVRRRDPGGPVHREPAAQHVVAVRRQPVSAADQGGHVDRLRGVPERRQPRAPGRRPAGRRRAGSSSRCRTPSRTRRGRDVGQRVERRCAARTAPRSPGCRRRRRSGRPRRRRPRPVRGAARAPARRARRAGAPPRGRARSPGSPGPR